MPILGTVASQFSSKPFGSFESIATATVGAGGSASIIFSSIPATYTHLQIRGSSKTNRSGAGQENIYYSFNSDTGSNYTQHGLYGDGTSAASYGTANLPGDGSIIAFTANNDANIFGAQIIDILDYANTNKYKTVRSLSGFDINGGGYVLFSSTLWRNTNAITSIKLIGTGTPWQQYSKFALYGIKGA